MIRTTRKKVKEDCECFEAVKKSCALQIVGACDWLIDVAMITENARLHVVVVKTSKVIEIQLVRIVE